MFLHQLGMSNEVECESLLTGNSKLVHNCTVRYENSTTGRSQQPTFIDQLPQE